jgi:WS/DGAT/MGAT family acyltransferase
MKQLSDTDNLMLVTESNNVFMHVASLAIYDPSSAPHGKVRFKDILKFVSQRIQYEPIFRRRLVTVPLSLDLPYWVEDRDIDVEHHVRHIALPHPGDWRQLCIQVARLHSRPLDRAKPLWEMYVIEGVDRIEGLPPGSFAVYTKLHHAAIDGEAATLLLKSKHSESPEPHDFEHPLAAYADRDPTLLELGARAVLNRVSSIPVLVSLAAEVARGAERYVVDTAGRFSPDRVGEFGRQPIHAVPTAATAKPPVTRFNHPISRHRVVEAAAIDLGEIRGVRQHVEDVTVNDVFMTVVGGALRKYLHSKGELPAESLTASVPVSLRRTNKRADDGNQVGIMVVPLHTEIQDPVARLEAIRNNSTAAKRGTANLGTGLAAAIQKLLPVGVSLMLAKHALSQTNLVVSNVHGPDQAWYLAGARLERFMPISVLYDGLGLNVTGFSVSGTLWISALACRKMMPDPAFFADCLRQSFAELKDGVAKRAEKAQSRHGRHAASSEHPAARTRARISAQRSQVGR